MEVIKCGLCKEEIEYAQRCRVYIKTDEPRPFQRISKRPHIGRFKLISTAKSTEHISFARRLKRLRELKKSKQSSSNSSISEADLKETTEKEEPLCEIKESSKDCEPIKAVEESIVENTLNRTQTEKIPEEKKTEIVERSIEPSSSVREELIIIRKLCRKSSCEITIEAGKSELQEFRSQTSKTKSLKQKMNYPHFQSSFEEYIKPILTKNNSVVRDLKSSIMNSDSDQVKRSPVTSTPKSVKNGPIINMANSDCETYYWLEIPKPKQPELRKLGYQFENLVAEVKHMKLPNPDWKIKIMVHKQEMVSVSFTKKLSPEKVVTVNAKSLVCEITIDGKKVVLLGSPLYIHSIKDLEIMLDIVNDVEPNSPMISYTKSLSQ
ncbi:uncharacterized protein LOC123309908 [Coccinella septempunctata]|uniref:uncharacterized protein LOC123309908 n=1 Tax=Coccinella septempunctata TaxID=41139 RepID=UPI001D06C28B|nr:uncharacterized protein LOC123309908 [Coccinella septempunctata]